MQLRIQDILCLKTLTLSTKFLVLSHSSTKQGNDYRKKIISFSLWGTQPKYLVGAINNVKLAKKIYPGWICRFYIGQSTINEAPEYIKMLKSNSNVEIIEMNEAGDWNGMFWRFFPISDKDVDIVISRDTDSRLSKREKRAVDEWLKSGKSFHIMRDHPYHRFKILGGMWGARKGILSDMKNMIKIYEKGNFYQVDQNFLAEYIYPIIQSDVFIHDAFGDGQKFPGHRKNYEFIGDVYDEFDKRNPEYWKELIPMEGKNTVNKKIRSLWRKLQDI